LVIERVSRIGLPALDHSHQQVHADGEGFDHLAEGDKPTLVGKSKVIWLAKAKFATICFCFQKQPGFALWATRRQYPFSTSFRTKTGLPSPSSRAKAGRGDPASRAGRHPAPKVVGFSGKQAFNPLKTLGIPGLPA